jgi:predicted nucleic acid-binding protein
MIDAGPCIALFNRDDAYHEQALLFVQNNRAPLVSNLAVATEVMYVLDFEAEAQIDFLNWVSAGAVRLAQPDDVDLARVVELMKKYADLPMDFADALLVAMCERLGIRHVASVDRHFSIYRFKGKSEFINVFSR